MSDDLAEFRRLADELPWPIWTQTAGGDVDWANRGWYEFAQLPRNIATNPVGWAKIVHPHDYQPLLDALAAAIARDGLFEMEVRVKPNDAPDDAYRWFYLRSQPRHDAAGRLAYRLGSLTDIHATRARTETETRAFQRIADSVPEILWTAWPDGAVDWYNGRWYEYTGRPPGGGGWDFQDVVHPDDWAAVYTNWTTSLANGTPYEVELRLRASDGTYRWFFARARPVRGDDGAITLWCGVTSDVDEPKRARDRERFYARASDALNASLSLAETLEAVTRLVVPDFADFALINLVDEHGEPICVAAHHDDPRKDALLGSLIGQAYTRGEAQTGTRATARNGQAALYESMPSDAWTSFRPEFRTLFEAVGMTSGVSVPLKTRGRTVGTLAAAMSEQRRRFSADDLPLFTELARRISPALANAEAYERERRVASSFQAAAMVESLPNVAGLTFDAVYEPAHADAAVGGDWYDAARLPDGRIVLSIGDVAGSGLDAAVLMASVRQSIRTASLINPEPGAVLNAVDRIVRATAGDRFVTAFVALFDPVTFELRAASAGHPAPLLLHPDGRVSLLEVSADAPLGLRRRTPVATAILRIEPGTAMIAYTDGLLELDRDAVRGEETLIAAARDLAGERLAHELYAAVVHDRAPSDDVALLAVSFAHRLSDVDCGTHCRMWRFASDDAAGATRARHEFAALLRDVGVPPDDVLTSEIVFGELVGNVYRYAPGMVEAILDVSGAAPVLHVLDAGGGFEFRPRLPSDELSERGRGLFLAASLAEELSVERRSEGGSHARAVLTAGMPERTKATLARSALI